jgi:hypothetical protein
MEGQHFTEQSYITGLLEKKAQLFQNYMTWITKQD